MNEGRGNRDEGDGTSPTSAFAVAKSATGRRNGHSSIKPDRVDEKECCRTAQPWELRKEPRRRSKDVDCTTLHLLPRPQVEIYRSAASTLPRLLTGQQAHSRVLAEAQKVSVLVIIKKIHCK